ncbi:hypothetical protein P2318_24885 [Myxococcaceae bacterium GXIMD 01537]
MDITSSGRWLAFPRILWLSLLAALVLALPTVWMGFMSDDYVHLLILEGFPSLGSPFDLFRFAGGDAEGLRRMTQEGPYPWWTLPELKLAFWRPLSSALAVLDHRLFGRNPMGWHLHSLVWALSVVALFGALLRRFLPGAVGALALLVFAIDDAHAMPTLWIANRNAFVAAAPALLGLWMHLEWRENRRAWALPVSLGGFAVGLMGGESALGLFAYVLAYELLGARGAPAERLRSLAPVALLGLGYVVSYKLLGYGAFGSGSYVDPVGETGRFLVAAAGRIPTLLGGLLLGVPADLWVLAPGGRPVLVGVGLLGVGLVALLVRAAWPSLTEDERRHCRWLFAGAFLSLLPGAGVFPSNRLLLLPGLGSSVAVAVVLVHARREWARGWRPKRLLAGAGVLALAHLVLPLLIWPAIVFGVGMQGAQMDASLQVTERELDRARLPEQRVVTLAVPEPIHGMYAPTVLVARGMPKPRSWWPLTLSPEPHIFTRTGPAAFELALTRGRFLVSEFEHIFRGPTHPLPQGTKVALEGMRVTVLEADAEGPTRLGFEFEVPLEDSSLVLLHWRDGALRRFTPPAEGARVSLSASP